MKTFSIFIVLFQLGLAMHANAGSRDKFITTHIMKPPSQTFAKSGEEWGSLRKSYGGSVPSSSTTPIWKVGEPSNVHKTFNSSAKPSTSSAFNYNSGANSLSGGGTLK